jgi:hypothetical protein
MALLLLCGYSMAQREPAPDDVAYVKPKKFSEYTFKFDKSKGFKLVYTFKRDDFKNKKMPEWLTFYFHGPQPVNVEAVTVAGCIRSRVPAFSLDYGRFMIRDNLYNREIRIEVLIHDPLSVTRIAGRTTRSRSREDTLTLKRRRITCSLMKP